jgi:hypothetical protein
MNQVPRCTHCRKEATERTADVGEHKWSLSGSSMRIRTGNLQLSSLGVSYSLTNRRASGSTSNRVGRHPWGLGLSCKSWGCITELKSKNSSPLNLGSDIGDSLIYLRWIHPSGTKKANTAWTTAWQEIQMQQPDCRWSTTISLKPSKQRVRARIWWSLPLLIDLQAHRQLQDLCCPEICFALCEQNWYSTIADIKIGCIHKLTQRIW